MSGSTPDRIDRLARSFAGGGARPGSDVGRFSGERSLDRGSLLRAGALGILSFSLRGVPTARAAGSAGADACTGGSLKACYATIEKNFDRFVHNICDTLKDKKGDPFGTASYSCYVGWLSSRLDARKDCRANCPKPKKKPPGGQSGGGGGSAPPGGGGHTPTCGNVDCAKGDICCKSDSGPICCAICCSKSGGCGSSDSDCK
jgi:hypothetical protein